jgi:hypothetical protein
LPNYVPNYNERDDHYQVSDKEAIKSGGVRKADRKYAYNSELGANTKNYGEHRNERDQHVGLEFVMPL